MAKLFEHWAVTREVEGLNPGQINTPDLKIHGSGESAAFVISSANG